MQTLTAKRMEMGFMIGVAIFASVLAATTWFLIQGNEGSGPPFGATPDMPVYSSIAELSEVSDLVILGTIQGVVGRETDYGTSNSDNLSDRLGVPTVFYEVAVTETLRGEAGGNIIVASPDLDEIAIREATVLRNGEQVLLFLKRQTTEDAPGITAFSDFYVTVSLDNGVFNLLDDHFVEPRMVQAFETTLFSLEDAREQVRP